MDETGGRYVEIGTTALRDPVTGGFLPAVPLYARVDEGTDPASLGAIENLGAMFLRQMKAYMEERGLAAAEAPEKAGRKTA